MIHKTSKRPSAQGIGSGYRGLLRERQRQRILEVAEAQFAASGMQSTTMAALAKAAHCSPAMLRGRFGTKRKLFEEVVERNAHARLAALRERLLSVPRIPPLQCIESMAQSTVLACVDRIGNACLMAWALKEAPEFAADIYRAEIGATEALWDSEIGKRFEDSPVRTRLAVHLVPFAAHTCMAFGFWLAALHHTPATAQGQACQYADAIVQFTQAILNLPPESLEAAS